MCPSGARGGSRSRDIESDLSKTAFQFWGLSAAKADASPTDGQKSEIAKLLLCEDEVTSGLCFLLLVSE